MKTLIIRLLNKSCNNNVLACTSQSEHSMQLILPFLLLYLKIIFIAPYVLEREKNQMTNNIGWLILGSRDQQYSRRLI